jgi:hypothetical protein
MAMHARGPAIDVSNFGGGHCRTYRQHPPGGPPSTSPTPMVAAAGPVSSTPKGPANDVSLNLVPGDRIFLATPTRGATAVNNTAMSKEKWRQEFRKKNRVLAVPRTRES